MSGGKQPGAGRPKGSTHVEIVRKRLQASGLVRRLVLFAKGEVDPANPEAGPVQMSPHQVTAALGLIRKILPDLAAVEHSGEIKEIHTVSAEPMTETDWQATYGGQRLNS